MTPDNHLDLCGMLLVLAALLFVWVALTFIFGGFA
jgi:hypothetical protein